jgi:hypothetical protein
MIRAKVITTAVFDLAQSLSGIDRYLIALAGQSLFPWWSPASALGGLDRTAPTAPVGALLRFACQAPPLCDRTVAASAWAQHCQQIMANAGLI